MKVIAEKFENIVVEKDDRWEIYNVIDQMIIEVVYKKRNPDFGLAIVHKWGYEKINEPLIIDSYDDIEIDLEDYGMTEEDLKERRLQVQEQSSGEL